MAKNGSLNAASTAKQDEFYTRYEDIQDELNNYTNHFCKKTANQMLMNLRKYLSLRRNKLGIGGGYE